MKCQIFSLIPRFSPAFVSVFLAGAVVVPSVANGEAFEGELTMNVREGRNEQEIEMAVKGSKLRFDVEEQGQEMTMIINSEAREMMMIMPAQRSYMVVEIPEGDQIPGQPDPDNFEWEESAETEEILGFKAKKYLLKQGGTESEIWATEELGSMEALMMDEPGPEGTPGAASALEKALQEAEVFPLRIIERGSGGREVSRTDVTKVEAREMDESLFEPPAGYQRMQTPGF